jgi:hypothetical protein
MQIWELKAVGQQFAALSQVYDYSISTASLSGPPNYIPGVAAPSFFTGNNLSLPDAYGTINYQFWGSGILTYEYNTNSSVVRVPNFLPVPGAAPGAAPFEAIPVIP